MAFYTSSGPVGCTSGVTRRHVLVPRVGPVNSEAAAKMMCAFLLAIVPSASTQSRVFSFGRRAPRVVPAAPASSAAAAAAANQLDVGRPVLVPAIIVLDDELNRITVAHRTLTIRETRRMDEDIVAAIIGLDEAESLVAVPPEEFP